MALNDDLESTDKILDNFVSKSEQFAENMERGGSVLSGGGGSSSIQGNVSTSKPGPGGAFSSGGFAAFAGGAPTSTAPSPTIPSTPERYKSADDRTGLQKSLSMLGNAASYALNVGMAGAALGPTTQEAVYLEQLSNRIKFYSNFSNSDKTNTEQRGFNIQKQASSMGTAISALDAPTAVNSLISSGLMPGLKNFRAGKGYTGILGGAALASNLTPGIGITGGAGVMAGLNEAYNVNMLRMFGVQVRNADGTGMNDLTNIIDQLYTLLSRGETLTERDIAISAMSGNALDSILNQYFGEDPNTRQTIIAGLIQKSKKMSFSKNTKKNSKAGSLEESGALSQGAMTTSNRSTSELQMLQNLSNPVVQGLTSANNAIQGMFNIFGSEYGTGKMAGGQDKMRTAMRKGLNLATVMETFAGVRGGAGGVLADALSAGNADKFLGGAALAAVLKDAENRNFGVADQAIKSTGIATTGETKASKAGPLYTGAITINVTTNADDPYAFGDAIYKAMTAKS
jgi:hypothetical protein